MTPRPRVALLVTCLVDVFRPRVAEAAVRLLEQAGFEVHVPEQTCCGQVNANAGDSDGAAHLALGMARAFEGYAHVVAPSGSCAGHLRRVAPGLLAAGSPEATSVADLAGRVHELTEFLHDVARVQLTPVQAPSSVAWHDSCSCLRDLGIRAQPRALLAAMPATQVREIAGAEECCGFGGTFSAKYPEISARIADRKIEAIRASGAQCLAGADLGCLLHLAGRMHRDGTELPVFHVAEILAGMAGGGGTADGSH